MSVEQAEERTNILLIERRPWSRILFTTGAILLVFVVMGLFYMRAYPGFVEPHAIDIGQIARNIHSGNGFTTHFIRPLNAALVKNSNTSFSTELNAGPLYPHAVATFFKIRPVSGHSMTWLAMAFLAMTVIVVYFLGRALFDWQTGLLSAAILGISTPILGAANSGAEWTMALFWFTLLLFAVTLHHKASQAEAPRAGVIYAVVSAAFIALLYMTHHVFFFLTIPLAIYFGITGSKKKLNLAAFLIAAVVFMSPWAYRNTVTTGFPVLGATAWEMMADTSVYPTNTLFRSTQERLLEPGRVMLFPVEHFSAFAEKLMEGSVRIGTKSVLILGLVALPFAIVGMLYKFKNASANAIRGLMYGIIPLMIACYAVFGVSEHAVILFAPAAAILSSAYFLLLLNAKKLHPFFNKSLIGGLVFITLLPALTAIIWETKPPAPLEATITHTYFGNLARGTVPKVIYTDVPWTAAWQAPTTAVWLPYSDEDAWMLQTEGLPMDVIILTPASGEYDREEAWYILHEVPMWREFVKDPEEGLEKIMKAYEMSDERKLNAKQVLSRIKRDYRISESISGYRALKMDALSPDYIQVFLRPGVE